MLLFKFSHTSWCWGWKARTHCSGMTLGLMKNLYVALTIEMGVDSSNFLVPRLSSEASNELAQLRQIQTWSLSVIAGTNAGVRSALVRGSSILVPIPTAPTQNGATTFSSFIWDSCASPRVQFFVRLLIHGRVQCCVNLCRKSIVGRVARCVKPAIKQRRRANTLSSTALLLKIFLGEQEGVPPLLKNFGLSWLYATGTSGNDGLALSIERKQPQSGRRFDCQKLELNYGRDGCRRKIEQQHMLGANS